MTAAYAYPTRPASTSKPQHLSKLEWYQRVRDDVRVSGRTIAEVFKETVGRCRPDENVFCSGVWRTQENLTADAGVSYRTFARWRDRFVDMGYLLQVDSGCGPQRYFVLKFPEWDVFDALEYAAYSLREISKFQSNEFASHIRKNVLSAVLKEWKRQVALDSFEEDSEELERELAAIESGCDTDQVTFRECGVVCEDPPEALQKLWEETPMPEDDFGKRSNCNLPRRLVRTPSSLISSSETLDWCRRVSQIATARSRMGEKRSARRASFASPIQLSASLHAFSRGFWRSCSACASMKASRRS